MIVTEQKLTLEPLADLGGAKLIPTGINVKLIEAVEVVLDAFIGHTRMKVSELMQLEEGAVIALDANLASLVELRLNGITVARGELVAVGDQFAVRITEIAP